MQFKTLLADEYHAALLATGYIVNELALSIVTLAKLQRPGTQLILARHCL
jgi:hypothetical protein